MEQGYCSKLRQKIWKTDLNVIHLLDKAKCDMKKVILIGFVVIGGLVVSCEKQDFKPRDCNHDDVPSWEERKGTTSSSSTGARPGEGDGGGITDPNNDEDGNGRKKI